jgi:hypothetical protein
MAKNPNNASYKSSDPAQMKADAIHKLTQRAKKKTVRLFGNPPPIQQMPYKEK